MANPLLKQFFASRSNSLPVSRRVVEPSQGRDSDTIRLDTVNRTFGVAHFVSGDGKMLLPILVWQ
jgi:hypothetical protein